MKQIRSSFIIQISPQSSQRLHLASLMPVHWKPAPYYIAQQSIPFLFHFLKQISNFPPNTLWVDSHNQLQHHFTKSNFCLIFTMLTGKWINQWVCHPKKTICKDHIIKQHHLSSCMAKQTEVHRMERESNKLLSLLFHSLTLNNKDQCQTFTPSFQGAWLWNHLSPSYSKNLKYICNILICKDTKNFI